MKTAKNQKKVTPESGAVSNNFVKEIAGLRGVAILGVLVFHANLFHNKGGYLGVDLFYVISGYLITGLLLREYRNNRSINLAKFYARRIRRLFPSALLVLFTVAVLTFFLAPAVMKKNITFDLISSLLFFSNYNFAHQATNYFASITPSPVLHFWSLSLEEQFYLFWPLSFSLLTRKHFKYKIKLFSFLLLLISISAAIGIFLLHRNQTWDFFILPSRTWEIAIGALLAITAPFTKNLPKWLKEFAAIISLAVLVFFIFQTSSPQRFPSWPSFFVVMAGVTVLELTKTPVNEIKSFKIIANPILGFLGEISYSLYLFHWPVLVFYRYWTGTQLTTLQSVIAILISFLLAIITTKFYEEPLRRGKVISKNSKINFITAIASVAILFSGLVVFNQSLSSNKTKVAKIQNKLLATTINAIIKSNLETTTAAKKIDSATSTTQAQVAVNLIPKTDLTSQPFLPKNYFSTVQSDINSSAGQSVPNYANVPSINLGPLPKTTFPSLSGVSEDRALSYNDRCHTQENLPPSTAPCIYGDTNSNKLLVLFGDSHALSWFPAVNAAAIANHWKLLSLTMSACSPATLDEWEPSIAGASQNCNLWRTQSIARIVAAKPMAILIAATRGFDTVDTNNNIVLGDARTNIFVNGMNQTIAALQASNAKIILIHDIPVDNSDPNVCLDSQTKNEDKCSLDIASSFDPNWFAVENNIISQNHIGSIDPTFWVCPFAPCPIVEGNTIVYLDGGHLTATFATELSPLMSAAINSNLG